MPWLDPLLVAVHFKCPNTVEQLLESRSCSPDGPFKEFVTPLHLAVLNDDRESIKYLMQHGADINRANHNGKTPLHLAVDENTSLETFKDILKAGPDLNKHDLDNNTPLHSACVDAYFDKVKELLKQSNPPVNDKDDEGATPIHLLVHICVDDEEAEVIEVINIASTKGFDINSLTHDGATILHIAGGKNYKETLLEEILRLDGIDVTIQDKNGDNFLHTYLRCRTGVDLDEEFLCHLLADDSKTIKKHDIVTILNQKNSDGFLPITFYIKKGIVNISVAKRLIDHVSDMNQQDNIGQSILHLAIQSALPLLDKRRVINHLIKKKANVNIRDTFGRTPIFFAIDLAIIKLFVENGANVNVTDQCKRSPLIATLSSCNPRICQFLINRGSRVNASDKFGHTALHYAAWENRLREIDVLTRNGADVFKKDRAGKTALDIAHFWRCRDAVKLLDDAMHRNARLQRRTKYKSSVHVGLPDDESLWVDAKRFVLPADYYKIRDIKEHFGIPQEVENYFKKAMKFPGIGLPSNINEASWVEHMVLEIIKQIAKTMGERDPRFKCTVLRSGSTREGTKVDDPDEFDFLFLLERFSEIVKVKTSLPVSHRLYGFESPSHISDTVDPMYQRYFDHQQSLICGRLRNDFFVLFSRILFSKKIWIFDEIYTDTFSLTNLPDKPVVNFKIFVIGAWYKGISVSIDAVPALRLRKWRPNGLNISVNDILPNNVLSQDFMLLCQELDEEMAASEETDVHTFFRLSCAQLEIELMHSLPEWIRKSYALAKMMKGNFMCPKIQYDNETDEVSLSSRRSSTASDAISSYMLKNCLFHIVASRPDILQTFPYSRKSAMYNSLALALEIYIHLSQAASSNRLPVYLLPGINILQEGTNHEDMPHEEVKVVYTCAMNNACERLKAFCEIIIKLYSL